MPRVLLLHELPPGGADPLTTAGIDVVTADPDMALDSDALAGLVPGFDGLVCQLTDPITAPVLVSGASGRLRVVATVAVGYDNVDVAVAHRLGIAVCNTPGVLDGSTADLAFLLILAACRRASDAEAALRHGEWTGWDLQGYLGQDVHGAVLGLVGFGRVARQVARRAHGFDMDVIHHARRDTGQPGYQADLGELLERSDVVSLHVPLTEGTRGLIGHRQFERMKRTAVLVNTSRGPVVDEGALVDALESGRIFGAGLDVFDGEPAVDPRLLSSPHAVLLPHIGSATVATRTRMAAMACRGVREVLDGGSPATLVAPAVPQDSRIDEASR